MKKYFGEMNNMTDARKPFFFDTTLRDGNQALKKPWNTKQKEIIFKELIKLGVQAVEVGFSGSNDMDFEACRHLASIAPDNMVIVGLARAVEKDIIKVYEAIKFANKPRIHIVLAMSPFNMKYVLRKEPQAVRQIGIEAVKYAKSLIGEKGDIQFSVEHFGDCKENLGFVIDSLHEIVEAGANVLNLPNTVERIRPMEFVNMVSEVGKALSDKAIISVHNHNDLGMATAATVESYFAGATQLECCLNGLGERAGNTNIYEVAICLHNCGVEVPLNLSEIYETALTVSEMSGIPIHEKMPLIGEDALAHRSGIHQDGASKTQGMKKGAYRPIHPSLIGRDDDEKFGFTSQSGKTALYEIIKREGYPITIDEAIRLVDIAKKESEKIGELPVDAIINIYLKEIFEFDGLFKLIGFKKVDDVDKEKFNLKFSHKGKEHDVTEHGDGPLECCLKALEDIGFPLKLKHYEQSAFGEEIKGVQADAMTTINLESPNGNTIICRGKDPSTAKANVKAIFNGLNLIYGQ